MLDNLQKLASEDVLDPSPSLSLPPAPAPSPANEPSQPASDPYALSLNNPAPPPPLDADVVIGAPPVSTTSVSSGGLTLNLQYTAAALAAPSAFRAGIEQAALLICNAVTDHITVNISVDYTGTGGGASAGPITGFFEPYSTVVSELRSLASTNDGVFDSLPAGTTIQGQSNVAVWNAQLKVWGLISPTATALDGQSFFSTDIDPNYLVGVALHELTHAMGRIPYSSSGAGDEFELFRFTSAGTMLFYGSIPAPSSYFSVNGGVNKLADYGTSSDPSDFLNSGVQGSTDSFNEYYGGGTLQTLSKIDLEQLDALGFHVTIPDNAPTGSVTISGTPTQGQTLTASNSLADADGVATSISYQWKAAGVAISGATSSTFTLTQAQVGKAITVTASYSDGFAMHESMTSSATASVANINDSPTGSVTITGTATQGQTLTASNTLADADGLGTISYQWKAAGVAIGGATSSTLVLGQSQVGKAITVTASYTDGFGTAESVTSSGTASVANVNDSPTGSVTITGTATQGQTLTASNTLADADGLGTISYQWKAAGVAIGGATSSTLLLGQSQVGKAITVTASYTDGFGTAESVTSSGTTSVANINDAPTGSVTITGTATLGQTLTAGNTLADLDGLGTISYQWKADGTSIGGATGSTLLLDQSVVGKVITVVASYTDGFGTAESVASSGTSAVGGGNHSPTGGVTISGTPTQGQTLTAANTLADADGLGTIGYQWQADGSNIGGATASTLLLGQAQVGKVITVVASYTDGGGTPESASSNGTTSVANVNDSPTGSVTISGTATQGQTLTAGNTLADLDGLGTISYQWKADGSPIGGATASTLVLGQAQVGTVITVSASYTDGFGAAESVTSGGTASVANINDAPTGSVTITGTATQGQTLTANNTLADLDGLGTISYQWKAAGVAIGGATSSTFVPSQAQVGKVITVTASYTDGFGTAENVTSSGTASVANINDAPTGTVTITGTATQGQTLTAGNTLADPDGLGTISYQWKADGSAIGGATSSTLLLAQAQVGKVITVVASYTDGFGTSESVASSGTSAVANVNDAPTGSVTISGVAAVGQTLTASNSLVDADGLGAITYQWQADGGDIAGATGSTLLLGTEQADKAISVVASYTDGGGTAESVSSSATGKVNAPPTGSVTIAGTAAQGETLTAGNTLADLNGLGTVSYQWQADGSDIAGATAGTLELGQAQVGKAITVLARYIDGNGTHESAASDATAAVANVNDLPTGSVAIQGTASQGQLLTADASTVQDLDGLGSFSYQWLRDGTNIASANSSTYRLVVTDLGAQISVRVSYTDGGGTAESLTSAATPAVAPPGNLNLIGTALADALTGGFGDDTLTGLAGNDTLLGGAGNDTLNGGAGTDSVDGQDDSDLYIVALAAEHAAAEFHDTGSTGTDEVRFTSTVTGTLTLFAGDNGIERVVIGTGTGAVADSSGTLALGINATAAPNGLAIFGNAGANKLTGTAFADTLDGGVGGDTLIGGNGNDTYFVDNARDLVTEASATGGTDTVNASISYILGTNVENLVLAGSAAINGTGNGLVNTITGNAANNVLDGKAGVDHLDGAEGSDIYLFLAATDHPAAEIADSGTSGSDEIRFAGTAGTLSLFAGDTGIERVVIGTGTAAAAVSSGTRALGINASQVGNGLSITGNAGANVITGTAFADTLDGGGGSDTLIGGAGDDVLRGGLGTDVLTGGAGADAFVFNTPSATSNKDTVTDFETGIDTLQFSKAVFVALGTVAGALAPEQFWSGVGAVAGHDADDRLIYDTATGVLYYDADGNGAGAAVQVALLGVSLHPSITAADILIIT
jgi:Ca2+-binding RTX toxin-like protein